MDDKLKNPFVFPQLDEFPSGKVGVISGGITLRDYFAAKVLQATISNKDELTNVIMDAENDLSEGENVANHAYYFADAMLKARDNE